VANTWSALLQASLQYELRLLPAWYFQLGAGITHYSNGSYRMPNYGLNMPQVNVGIHYASSLLAPPTSVARSSKIAVEHGSSLWLWGQIGLAEHLPVDGPKFVTNTASLVYGYRWGLRSSFTAGLDYMVNPSLQRWFRVQPDWKGSHTDAAGITVGHVLHVSQVNVLTQVGFSFYKPFPLYPVVYQRIGLFWQPHRRWQGGVVLKMHGFSAEVVELAVGARLW
jgi:hypothetical protein